MAKLLFLFFCYMFSICLTFALTNDNTISTDVISTTPKTNITLNTAINIKPTDLITSTPSASILSTTTNISLAQINQTNPTELPTQTFINDKTKDVGKNETNDFSTPIDKVNFFKDVDPNNLANNTMYNSTTDHHVYYNSSVSVDNEAATSHWNEFKNIPHNEMLSTSHRKAMTRSLSFDFPFYGHTIRNITIATGGFIYTGDYVHSWLAATQYIAPLMANFDTNISNSSFVRFSDNGTSFTVIWENVHLQNNTNIGTFTFSTTLYNSGDIVFVYYKVPILIESIQDDKHPVKVGLSDAYIIDKSVFFSRRKTIYEYHRVTFESDDIKNGTIIKLTALPTCLTYTDCESCYNQNTTFQCGWCPTLNRCSSGTDRKRQEWLQKGCDQSITDKVCFLTTERTVDSFKTKEKVETKYETTDQHDIQKLVDNGEKKSNISLTLGILLPVSFAACVFIWVLYAFRNPHTKSGQFLIQYRPSQWSWRRGEARYTAATIHM